jgi:Uma2 family endonuclease
MTQTVSPIPRTAQPAKFDNAAEWLHALGDVPLERIVMDPWPGTATEQDLLTFVERDKRLVELIDGTLVEKPGGWFESLIAARLLIAIGNFVYAQRLGVVAGADGMLKMRIGRVRLPDVTFVSKDDLPGGNVPPERIPMLPPTLAVEVISESNTDAEMRQKMKEYFESGTRLVWLIYPQTRTVQVYRELSDEPAAVLTEKDALDGEAVLPGFTLSVAELFSQLP